MANVFSQMKDLYQMQREAKELQKKLRAKMITGQSSDGRVKLFMNGAQEYQDINIDHSLLAPEMESELKRLMRDAFKDYQKSLQKEMAKDFDMDQLKRMVGGS